VARLDAAERSDQKSVAVFEIGELGRSGEVEIVPLRSTPFYQIEITDPETQIPLLASQYPDAAQALVHYTLHWRPDRHDLPALLAQIERIFPFWYGRSLEKQGANVRPAPRAMEDAETPQLGRNNVAGTVRDFLGERFADHAEKDAVLKLAESLLAEEGWK
jgi:hypothetical protein